MIAGRFVEPLGLMTGPVAFHALREGFALPLQGGDIAFSFVRLIEDGEDLGVGPIKEVPEDWHDAMHAIAHRPAPFAGLAIAGDEALEALKAGPFFWMNPQAAMSGMAQVSQPASITAGPWSCARG